MYSIAQHAVAKGYGKIEYFRAHPIALSSRVSTTASPRSASSPEVARRGSDGGGRGFATSRRVSGGSERVKGGSVRWRRARSRSRVGIMARDRLGIVREGSARRIGYAVCNHE